MSTRPVDAKPGDPPFLNVLLNMQTAEMARIPEDRWPRRLSRKLLEKLPENKRRIVARILRLRQPEATVAAPVPAAAELEGLHALLAEWTDTMAAELDQAEDAIRRWRDRVGTIQPGPIDDDEAVHMFDQCIDYGSHLALHMNSRRLELHAFARGIQSAAKDPPDARDAGQADRLAAGRTLFDRLRRLASRYYLLRLNLVWMEMDRAHREIGRCADNQRRLAVDAERVREELRHASAWTQRLTGRSTPSQITALQDMIQALEQERHNCVYDVAAEEMHGWLNAVTDAYLDPHCNDIARSQIQKSIRAFMSLARYRRRVARTVWVGQERPSETGRREIDDSRLIESCIDGHRSDIWQELLLGPAEVADRLARLREQLIRDYRLATAQRPRVEQ